ncbi:MAG: phage tail tube protein [Methylocystis sp.]|uniref:phage tail tube protein n=1 Tax=Methylocystis sp. TaxID=1911079 RepID=UPI003DA6A32A
MTFASGLQRDVAVIDEVTWGTTPATPAFSYARVLEGSGMNATKQTELIRQLSNHSNPVDLVQLGQDASGSYALVPSYGGAFESMLLATIRQSAFTTNTAWNGRAILSKTFEEKITGTAANYLRYTGVEIESMDISLAARGLMEATIIVQGKVGAYATSLISGATYTAVNSEEYYNALGVANIALVGLSPVPSIRSLKMSIKHALTPINVVGSLTRLGNAFDMIEVTGSIETLFETNAALAAFLAHSSGSLAFTVGTVTSKKYTFTMPKVYFQEGNVSQAGTGPVLATLGFSAVYDGTNGTIKIDKAVA